jgi:hypothetical protein
VLWNARHPDHADVRPDRPVRRLANNTFHWMTSLPVAFTPAAGSDTSDPRSRLLTSTGAP